MKVISRICCILFLFVSLTDQAAEGTTASKTDACSLLQRPEFLNTFARSIGLRERELEKAFIDTNSGKSNSELVLTLKPISNVPAAKVAQSLRDTIKKNVLSIQFAGSSEVITEEKPYSIYSVGVNGHDQGYRIRISADIITLSDGKVRLKILCVTSPE